MQVMEYSHRVTLLAVQVFILRNFTLGYQCVVPGVTTSEPNAKGGVRLEYAA